MNQAWKTFLGKRLAELGDVLMVVCVCIMITEVQMYLAMKNVVKTYEQIGKDAVEQYKCDQLKLKDIIDTGDTTVTSSKTSH